MKGRLGDGVTEGLRDKVTRRVGDWAKRAPPTPKASADKG